MRSGPDYHQVPAIGPALPPQPAAPLGCWHLELGLGGDGGQLLDGGGQLRVLVRLDSVRLGGERSQQVPVAAHVVPQGCDVTVLGRLQAVRMPVERAAS